MKLPRKLFLLVSVSCVFIAGCGGSVPSGPAVVTKAEAGQIKVGMTLEEAQKIIGDPGESPPVGEGTAELAAAGPMAYVWSNPDGSSLMVSVQHGKIQQVSPLNLK